MKHIREDENIGFRIARRLGLQATGLLGAFGLDGHVYRLEDGRVMKVSFSIQDAAAAIVLHKMRVTRTLPNFLPRVDSVFTEIEEGGHCGMYRTYSIIREDIEDITPPMLAGPWRQYMDQFDLASKYRWRNPNVVNALIAQLQEINPLGARIMHDVLRVVAFLEQEHSLKVEDVRDVNIGKLSSGQVTIRDMGVCHPPQWSYEAVSRLPEIS